MIGKKYYNNLTLAGVLLLLTGFSLVACGDSTATALTSNKSAVSVITGSQTTSISTAVISSGTTTSNSYVVPAPGSNPCPNPTPVSSKPNLPELDSNGTEKPPTLRVGLIPNQNPDNQKKQYSSFKTYLEKELGQPVDLFVANDYAGVVQAMVADKLDLAYFGGLTYVQAREQADIYPIVTEVDRYSNTKNYCSAIIVPVDSPVKTVADLKGKIFAFGDISSTSGSLFPRIMLDKAGLKVPENFKEIKYTGGHDATALAVQNGAVDGGGIEERILDRLIDQGTVDKNKIRLVERTAVPGYPWCVRNKLDPVVVDKITNIFLNIKDPDLLKLLRAEGYTKVKDADYEYVREQALRLGLLTLKK